VESFNGTMCNEYLNEHWLLSVADAREIIGNWRIDYSLDSGLRLSQLLKHAGQPTERPSRNFDFITICRCGRSIYPQTTRGIHSSLGFTGSNPLMIYYLLVLSVIMTLVGGIWLYFCIAFIYNSIECRGTITGWQESEGSESGSKVYHSKVKFVATDGKSYEFVGGIGHPTKPKLDGELPVRYSEKFPEKAKIIGIADFWLGPLLFLIMGGIAMFVFLKKTGAL
jgi:CDGSH-type Zn-finger protein